MKNATRLARQTTLATLFFLIAGCSSFEFPWVHKYDLQQGNIINQEMIDQLKPGMSKRQVRFVMGPPLLHDTFTNNRWDYYYGERKADGEKFQERVTIYFADEIMTHFSGDYRPTPPNVEEPVTEQPSTENTANVQQDKG
jgi:outer membrane protein assembly factor BamE